MRRIIERDNLDLLIMDMIHQNQKNLQNAQLEKQGYAEMMHQGKIFALKDLQIMITTITEYEYTSTRNSTKGMEL